MVLIALYYLTPFDHMTDVPLWLSLTIGIAALSAVTLSQVRAIIRAPTRQFGPSRP
jgi:hypothetical protein